MADETMANASQETAGTGSTQESQAQAKTTTEDRRFSQADIDKAIQDRLARARKTFEKELSDSGRLLSEEEVTQRREAEAAAKQKEEESLAKAGHYEELLKREKTGHEKTRLEYEGKLKQANSMYENILVENALFKALNSPDSPKINGDIGYDHIKKLIMLDGVMKIVDGDVVIVDGDGQVRYSNSEGRQGERMSPSDFVSEWLDKNPWAQAPTGKSGAGTMAANGRAAKLPPDWDTNPMVFARLTPEQKQLAKKQLGYDSSSGTGFTFKREEKG